MLKHTIFKLLKLQAVYNVIAYRDRPRLQTAVELLRTTQEIEYRLKEVLGTLAAPLRLNHFFFFLFIFFLLLPLIVHKSFAPEHFFLLP